MGQTVNRIRNQLDRGVREHESASIRLDTLRNRVEAEIELHQLLLSLGRNELLLEYLGQLEDDFSRVDSLRDDGLSDEQRRSMHIPPGATFQVKSDAKSLTDVTMLVRHKAWLIEISLHERHGLVVRPIEGHRDSFSASLSSVAGDETRLLQPPRSEG